MWKECNIHLLPSNEASSSMVIEVCKKQLSDLNIGQLAYTPRLMPSKEYFNIINLYVTDDSEIREGDWIIWNSKVVQAINTKYHKTTKKIIATTDTSLNLSQIPKQFIEYYISEYNAGRKIEKVDVEEVEYMTQGWIPRLEKWTISPENILRKSPVQIWYSEHLKYFNLNFLNNNLNL